MVAVLEASLFLAVAGRSTVVVIRTWWIHDQQRGHGWVG